MRKQIACLLLCLMVWTSIMPTGLGWESFALDSVPVEKQGGTMRVGLGGSVTSLNPLFGGSIADQSAYSLMYRSLYYRESDGSLTPDLASSKPIYSSDGLSATITIKNGLKWSNGSIMSSDDVIFTLQKYRELNGTKPNKWISNISSFEKISSTELKINFAVSNGQAISFLADVFIISKEALTGLTLDQMKNTTNSYSLDKNQVSGPYKPVYISDLGSLLILEKNPNYEGPAGNLERIVLQALNYGFNSSYYRDLLLNDQIDLLQCNEYDIRDFYSSTDFTVLKNKSASIDILYFNALETYTKNEVTYENLLSDPKLRKGIALLLDRNKIIQEAYYGNGSIIDTQLYPGYFGALPGGSLVSTNLVEGKKLIEEAGWQINPADNKYYKNGKKLTFTLEANSGNVLRENAILKIASQLNANGLDVRTSNVAFNQMVENLNVGRYEACILGAQVGLNGDFRNYYYTRSSDTSMNKSHFSNAEVDDLINRIERTNSEAEEKSLATSLQQKIVNEMPSLPLVVRERPIVMKSNLHNVSMTSNYQFSRNWDQWYFDTPKATIWATLTGGARVNVSNNRVTSLSGFTNAPAGTSVKVCLNPSANEANPLEATGVVQTGNGGINTIQVSYAQPVTLMNGMNQFVLTLSHENNLLATFEQSYNYSSTKVDGRVKTYDGASISSNANIEVYNDQGMFVKSLQLNNDGSFEIAGLTKGSYTLVASPWSGVPQYTYTAPQNITIDDTGIYKGATLEFVLPKPFISGNVFASDGTTPYGGGYVSVKIDDPQNGYFLNGRGYSSRGEFTYGTLADGKYLLYANPKNGDSLKARSNGIPFEVKNGVPTPNQFNISLNNAQVMGKVTADGKLPTFTTTIEVRDSTGRYVLNTNANSQTGDFGLGGLNAGTYSAMAYPQNGSMKYSNSKPVNFVIDNNGLYTGARLQLSLQSPQILGTLLNGDTETPNSYGYYTLRNKLTDVWISGKGTNASGQFSIAGLEDGTYIITGYPNEKSTQYGKSNPIEFTITNGVASSLNLTLRLSLPQFKGTLKDPNNVLITSVTADVRDSKDRWVDGASVSNTGTFKVSGLQDGNYTLILVPRGSSQYPKVDYKFLIKNGKAYDLNQAEITTVDLKTKEPLIKGILKSQNGVSIANGWFSYLKIGTEGRSNGTSINSLGQFFIGDALTDGNYKIYTNTPFEFVGADAMPDPLSFVIENGQLKSPSVNQEGYLEVKMVAPQVIGTVAQNGNPILRDTRVEVRDLDNSFIKDAFVNKDGKFYIGGLIKGDYQLILRPSNQAVNVAQAEPYLFKIIDVNTVQNIQLSFAQPQIKGILKDPSGVGEMYGRVELRTQSGIWLKSTNTTKTGEFNFGGLSAGTYDLIGYPYYLNNYGRTSTTQVTITQNGPVQTLEISLRNPQLTGRVMLPGGQTPTSYGWINVRKALPNNQYEYLNGESINGNGEFSLSGLTEGTYELVANPNRDKLNLVKSNPKVIVVNANGTVSEQTVTISLNSASIQGQILYQNDTNEWVASKYGFVEVFKKIGGSEQWATNADANALGQFFLGSLEDGDYRITACPDNRQSTLSKSYKSIITIQDGKVTMVDQQPVGESSSLVLKLQKAQINSTIMLPNNSPEKWGYINVFKVGENSKSWVFGIGSNDQGKFAVGGLEAGTYELIAYPNRWGQYKESQAYSFTIGADGSVSGLANDFKPVLRTNQLFGKMKYDNASGASVYNGWVEIYKDSGNGTYASYTSCYVWNGDFVCYANLDDGTYKLRGYTSDANKTEYKNSAEMTFVIENGQLKDALNVQQSNNEVYILKTQVSGVMNIPIGKESYKTWVEVGTIANSGTLENPGDITWAMSSIVSNINGMTQFELSGLADGKYVVQGFVKEPDVPLLKSAIQIITIKDGQLEGSGNITISFE